MSTPPRPDPELAALLTEAHLRIRQERYEDARERLAAAKQLAGDVPAVLELEGDIAFAQRRYKQAELLYHRAFQADPKNGPLEEKFATALVKVHEPEYRSHDIRDDDDDFWSFHVARPPWASGLLALILPGLGQLYNGDMLKGGALLFVTLGVWSAILTRWHVAIDKLHAAKDVPENIVPSLAQMLPALQHDIILVWSVVLAGLAVYSMIDAVQVAISLQPVHTLQPPPAAPNKPGRPSKPDISPEVSRLLDTPILPDEKKKR